MDPNGALYYHLNLALFGLSRIDGIISSLKSAMGHGIEICVVEYLSSLHFVRLAAASDWVASADTVAISVPNLFR